MLTRQSLSTQIELYYAMSNRELVCECLRRIEKRLNSLLRVCQIVPYEVVLYRLASLFSAMLQMSIDIAYVICREITASTRCENFDDVVSVLKSAGILRRDSERALREINNMLLEVSRLSGPNLSMFIRENLERAVELTLTYAHDLIRYIDEYCRPRFSLS